MIVGLVLIVGVVIVIGRARSRRGRLPTLTHDYSADRAVFQQWPGRRRRRFK